ncbi:MAG: FAD-binding oxidoreductase [Candidatus Tectomicrobia bacterium]
MSADAIVQALREVLHPASICTERDTLTLLARDALHPERFPAGTALAQPLCVVRAQSTQDVSALLRVANASDTPVIPIGGSSGLMGGAASIISGIVLDLRQLQTLHIRPADRMADVGAGVTINALNRAAARHGLMCGHDPWTVAVATVGGTISTNSLGYLGGKYGAMGDQVLGLEVVLPTGEVVSTRAVEKSSTGPALSPLFIGAEGCFGIITRATLRLFPLPQARLLQSWAFQDFATGFAAINALLDAGVRPGLLDYGDQDPTLEQDPPSALLVSYEGPKRVAAAEAEEASALCKRYKGRRMPQREVQKFWDERHALGDAYAAARAAGQPRHRPHSHLDYLHVALPPSAVLNYRRQSLELLAHHGLQATQTGLWDHAGLFSLVYTGNKSAEIAEVQRQLLMLCQDLDGSMEYCHGVGTRLAALMAREHGEGIEVLRRLKQSLDPGGILNPGKLDLTTIPSG